MTFDLGDMTLTMEIFKNSCATSCAHSIGATFISLGMWATHEGWMCMGMSLHSCDLWPWSYDLDLGNLKNILCHLVSIGALGGISHPLGDKSSSQSVYIQSFSKFESAVLAQSYTV